MKFEEKIKKIIASNNSLIYIQTNEEERLENILININNRLFRESIQTWDFVDGYKNQPESVSVCKQNPLEALNKIEICTSINTKIFFLKDFHIFFNDATINRKLKNLYRFLKKNNQCIFMSGTDLEIPNNLTDYITQIKLPLPNEQEIENEIEKFFKHTNININNNKTIINKAYKGFTIKQIRLSLFQLLGYNFNISQILNQIFKEKSHNLNKNNGLKLYNNKNTNIGGLNNLKKWLKSRKITLSKQANAYGIKTPKGILLVGIQGTGKSLSAHSISAEWNLPLLKLDIGKVFASTLGESETRIEKIIQISQAMSPCILWIDEIDKIFTKNNNINDSGTTQRVTSILLSWLSEKESEIFIIATANTINNLPSEMLRKGRFDEIFFVDLPNFKNRMNIFKVHLKRIRPLTWNRYNIYYFSKISSGFSGSEIEQAIVNAMYLGFNHNREFTSIDIINSIRDIIPMSRTNHKEIKKMRNWGYSGKVQIA
uniref:Uncharacterized AAA domain-containing protein ycf46 n=1 Tax=Kapraunia schneideri TaxID=717899 RepID=A0A1Z1MS88_9FLOR|nr:hypothetical protein [Kapraunia schneideri]ARW68816.1 hypothetical protein [Kapraunia schneideri]